MKNSILYQAFAPRKQAQTIPEPEKEPTFSRSVGPIIGVAAQKTFTPQQMALQAAGNPNTSSMALGAWGKPQGKGE